MLFIHHIVILSDDLQVIFAITYHRCKSGQKYRHHQNVLFVLFSSHQNHQW